MEDYVVGRHAGDAERLRHVLDATDHVLWVSDNADTELLNTMSFADILARQKPRAEYGMGNPEP